MANLIDARAATFLGVFTASQSVFGCIANAMVLFYFLLTRRSLKTTADKLILNLTIADIFALASYLPWRSYLLLLNAVTNNSRVYTSLFVTCIFSTANATLLIGIEKFIAVVFPFRYKVVSTFKVFLIAIVASWMTAILLGIAHYLSLVFQFHTEYELFLSALSFLQLILLSVIYPIILRTARVQTKKMVRQLRSSRKTFARRSCSLKRSICVTFIMVCIAYAVFIPFTVYRIVSTADESLSRNDKRIAWRWLIAFTFLNSCFDPLIYFFGMKKYRSSFCRFCLKGNHGNRVMDRNTCGNVTRQISTSGPI